MSFIDYYLIDSIKKLIPILKIEFDKNKDLYLEISSDVLLKVISFFKKHYLYQFDVLIAVTCVDYPEQKNRFEVTYCLSSSTYNRKVYIQVYTNELVPLDSIVSVYCSANWWEREIWDMFGVFFKNHPDLRRILTDYGFQGHPLRKDFPLSGYVEVSYDEKLKRVSNKPLELTQECRSFSFKSPWVSTKF